MKLVSGFDFGGKLIKILGLPKHTKSFELRCAVDEIVTVKCIYYPELSDDGTCLIEELAEYELVKKSI